MKEVLALLISLTALSGLADGGVLLGTDFEGSSSLPAGWTQNQITGSATWAIQTGGKTGGSNPATAHGGTNNATLYATNANANTTQLLSPVFSTADHTDLSLTFWHTQELWSPDQDELKMFYSSDGGSNWTQLAYYTSSVSTWTQRTLPLPAASANSRIAFEGNAKFGYGVCLDDIQVRGTPTLWSEVSVSATDATASEAGSNTGTWTITRVGDTTSALSVNFTLSGTATAGSDYNVSIPSPITFAAGQTSRVVTLTPVDDTVGGEGVELATLTLTSGTGYSIDQTSADISIIDDDGYGLNILVLGSTHAFSEGEIGGAGVVHEKPFNPATIATRLQSILSQDAALGKTVNVVFEDIYKSKSSVTVGAVTINKDFRCYSLYQHLMWPDGKAARLNNLRGAAGTRWDYIVVCEDSYVLAHFPGMFAEGVKMLKNEVSQGVNPAQIVLLAQWPESGSTFTANGFNEIAHRVGDSAGATVVPAGKAWDSYGSKDTNTAHPTPKGQYLAAAAIYSKLFNRSASTSGYSYPSDGTNIANHAHSVVQSNAGVAQYSGLYTTANAFQMKYYRDRQVDWCEYGTSTEEGFATGLMAAYADAKVNHIRRTPPASGNPVDLSYSRGSDAYEPDKQYQVDPLRHDRVHGFPMQHGGDTGEVSMIYGIDKHYETNGAFENGSDLGVAYSMVREGEVPKDVRGIPVRLMWSKIDHFRPEIPGYSDSWHLSNQVNHAVGAYMYTLLSGRCPVDVEPVNQSSAEWQLWWCRKVGYETAWQMAHLTTRAPGFRVAPSTATRTSVTTTTPEIMSVRFLNPPTSDVTVTVSISDPNVATVSPSTLTFTPANYNTAQEVTVTGKEITPVSAPFNVVFSTTSTDLSYHGLGDSWRYDALRDGSTVDLIAGFDGNNTSTTSGSTKTLSNAHRGPDAISAGVTATLWTTDTMGKEFQWTLANQTSLGKWGTLTLIPTPVTLNTTNVATFAAPTTLNFTINNTAGTQSLDLQNLHFSAMRDSGAALQLTITYAGGNLAGTGGTKALVNDTGVNRGYDFDLTAILTDRILAPGETATFTIAQTTSETGRLRLDDIAISGEVLNSGPDTTAPNPDPMTWASEPTAVNSSSITMTATTASDPSGVQYFFDETSGNPGGSVSGWQDSPAYTDTGLQPNTQYAYTVTARDNAGTPNTTGASAAAFVTTSPASSPVSAGNSTVVASPTAIPADGTTTSTITVTLKDFGSAPVSGKTVSLVSNGSATIQTSNNTSDANGVVTFTVKSSTVGTQTFTATGDSVVITQTAAVQFTAVSAGVVITPVSATSSTWINSPNDLTRSITAAINGSLLSAGGTSGNILSETVTAAGTSGHWLSASLSIDDDANFRSTTEVLTFNLGGSFNVNAFHLWPYIRTENYRGLKTCAISFSKDGGSTYPMTIPAATLGNFTIGPVSGTAPVQTLTFTEQTGVTHIRLTNLTTFGSTNYIGISELRFGGSTTPSNTFASWIGGFNVGSQTAFPDDPDKDGLTNGIESWFGSHPGEFTSGVVPGVMNAGAGTFTFSHPLNENPPDDVSAAYRWSKDLSNFHYSGQSDAGETTVTFTPGTPSNGMVTVTATITGTNTDRIFVDIQVTQD